MNNTLWLHAYRFKCAVFGFSFGFVSIFPCLGMQIFTLLVYFDLLSKLCTSTVQCFVFFFLHFLYFMMIFFTYYLELKQRKKKYKSM